MILDSTTKSIQIVLAAPVTTNQLSCLTSWADLSASTFLPGSTDAQTAGTTPVALIAGPANGVQRQIKSISIYNDDSANATVTVQFKNGNITRTIVKVALQPGWTLQFGENSWSVIGSNGSLSQPTTSPAAGSDKELQYNDGGSANGADQNLTWDKNNRILALAGTAPSVQLSSTNANPSQPGGNKLSIFSQSIATRSMAAQLTSTGVSTSLQPLLARNKAGLWNPPGNATTVPGVFGLTAPTAVGTLTSRNVTTTTLATRLRRLGYVSASQAGNIAGQYINKLQFSCGSGSNDSSGFFYVCRFVPSSATAVNGMRMFVGVTANATGPTNVDSSTLTNSIGLSQLGTDMNQLYITYGGTIAQTPIPLGAANFPAQTLSTVAYEFAVFCPSTVANTYYVQALNISTGASYNATLTGDATVIPTSNTLLTHAAYVTNNSTASAVGIDISSLYIETDA